MADIIQPAFNPAYEPSPDGNGGYHRDSILIHCANETENVFTYNAFDMQPRWFWFYKDGVLIESIAMAVGETRTFPNVPGYSLDYISSEYHYNIIPGQCRVETTTTTQPPTTTTAPPESTTTTTSTQPPVTTTIPEDTTTTSSPPQDTTTTEVPPTTVSLPPTTETQSTPSTSATVQGICTYDSTVNRYRNSSSGEFMSSTECPSVPLTPTASSTGAMPSTGWTGASLLIIALALVLLGLVINNAVKLVKENKARKNNNPLTDPTIHERISV